MLRRTLYDKGLKNVLPNLVFGGSLLMKSESIESLSGAGISLPRITDLPIAKKGEHTILWTVGSYPRIGDCGNRVPIYVISRENLAG